MHRVEVWRDRLRAPAGARINDVHGNAIVGKELRHTIGDPIPAVRDLQLKPRLSERPNGLEVAHTMEKSAMNVTTSFMIIWYAV